MEPTVNFAIRVRFFARSGFTTGIDAAGGSAAIALRFDVALEGLISLIVHFGGLALATVNFFIGNMTLLSERCFDRV